MKLVETNGQTNGRTNGRPNTASPSVDPQGGKTNNNIEGEDKREKVLNNLDLFI